MKKLWWAPALVLALVAPMGAPVRSQSQRPAELDPLQMYTVTPQSGAWMILAANYTGENGQELARQMVIELRNRHRLPAFVWNVSAEARRRQEEEQRQRLQQANPGAALRPGAARYKDEWAVLIGGYADVNAAAAALPNIRKLPMPDLRLPDGNLAVDYITTLEPTPDGRGEVKRGAVSPFVKAMCVPNPTVRRDPTRKKFDPFWVTLNEDEGYSLLKCKKPWTFAVKEYVGAAVIQSKASSGGFLDGLSWLGGKKPGQILDAAGQEAHNLAEALRQYNFEVYVFHTRNSSVVTIGSFDSPNDPQAQRIKQQYLSFQQQLVAAWAPTGQRDHLQLFPTPLPMEVPHP
jgi:hypothetical protein